jgi:hypothetical protein
VRIPGLAVLFTPLLLVAGLSALAQTPPDATTTALASFQKLDAALLPLKSPLYHRADRQKVPDLLADLKRKVDAIRLPDAERGTPKAAALERLQRSVADTDARELAFWTSPAAVGDELPTATADALRRDFAAVRAAFSVVTPAAAVVSGTPLPVNGPRDARATPDATARSVVRAGTSAQRSIADPNGFFDAEATRGGNAVAANGRGLGPDGVAPAGGPRRVDSGIPPSAALTPVPRVSDLKTGTVPMPEPPPATPSKYKSFYDKSSPVAKLSMLAAAATVPLVGPEVLAMAIARPQESRETQFCRDAAGGGLYAKMCGAPYPYSMLGPATAGFMHSLFSLGSLGTIAASLVIGILIPAITGGIGIIFTIIKALLGVFAFFALKSLLTKLWDIGHDLMMLPSTDPRHWRAARELGAVAAQLLLAIAATIGGVKLGQSTGWSEGIKTGLVAIQTKFAGAGAAAASTAPSGILAQMRELFKSETPSKPNGIGANRSPTVSPPEPPRPPVAPETTQPSGTWTRIKGATDAENALDEYLHGKNHEVAANPEEGQRGAGRQGDRYVDKIKTEYKTVSGVRDTSSDGLSDAISSRIMDGRGQAGSIIVDARPQAGMTEEIALRAIRRAYGADGLAKIKSIRIIGNGFDVVRPRVP